MLKDLPAIKDPDGVLVPVEFKELPFTPRRVFYVTGVPAGEERGGHAHYFTEQFLICVRGKILVSVHDGTKKTDTLLIENQSIYVGRLEWDSQTFLTGDDILLSICSTSYNKKDYIEDFDEFIRLSKKPKASEI